MNTDAREAAWHEWSAIDVMAKLETGEQGLSEEEARRRVARHGRNALEEQEQGRWLPMLAHQVNNPLIYLLLAAAAVSLFGGHAIDAAVIGAVVILNTALGFFQEWRAEGALAALRDMAAPLARVKREGNVRTIDAAEVAPGDLLVLETGDRVPADGRIVDATDLQVDESALTGESEPVWKDPAPGARDLPVADRRGMAWMTTSVTGGRGLAVAVGRGMETQIGRIAGDVRAVRREETPLQQRMRRLGVWLGAGSVVLAAAVFGLGVLQGHGLGEMLLMAVAVAVSAIPEGLPAVISVTLALGVRRMARRHAIIRRLPAVETLGSITVICTDKTGTITRNQMTVRRLWAGGAEYAVGGEGYQPDGAITDSRQQRLTELPAPLACLLRMGVLNNNTRLNQVDGRWMVEGNPSEGALLAVAIKAGIEPDPLRTALPRVAEVPFSSSRKYMATLHRDEGETVAWVKGAPDRLLPRCTHVLTPQGRIPLDPARKKEMEQVNSRFAGDALRVIAAACRRFPAGQESLAPEEVEQELTLIGLWGMIDPPHEESGPAVAAARQAGIRPIMITGDHAETAMAIARQVGIVADGKALSSADIDRLEGKALAEASLEAGVIARVAPAHKLKILEALKGAGETVAMTGDGVNDAPALKAADIGVAMGRSGTEVAKEAADMVLTDDNFATIVSAVEEGRVIFNNLRRVIFFLLTTNLGEVLTMMAALLIGMELPLTAVMILWINLVTDGACTVPLGVEPGHEGVLNLPPRGRHQPVIDAAFVRRMAVLTPIMAGGTLLLFWYELRTGSLAHGRSVAFTTLAAFQWFQAFNARSRRLSVLAINPLSNRWLLVGVGAAILLQVAAVQTPLGHTLFGTVSLTALDWLLVVGVSSTIWIADELRKLAGRRASSRL